VSHSVALNPPRHASVHLPSKSAPMPCIYPHLYKTAMPYLPPLVPATCVAHVEVALLAAPPLVRSPQRAPASSVITRQARRFRRPPAHGVPRLASWIPLSSSDPCVCPFRGNLPSSPSEVRVDPHPVLHQSVRLRVLALLHGLLLYRAPPHIIQQYLQIVHLGFICTRPAARVQALRVF
jgi:hypothetical protein